MNKGELAEILHMSTRELEEIFHTKKEEILFLENYLGGVRLPKSSWMAIWRE